ncbi:hypothetical protein B9Z55_027356 [Caenorhabditis nigoni]|uniref:Uncharacterized protein n=3 Tax=Caenorhabditis nigoni TaxID=1611254 RepID=A0A2G5SG45_9PELO|nr:hypothetical protein B9Z55_027356 [Caenorhabditis nigoni]
MAEDLHIVRKKIKNLTQLRSMNELEELIEPQEKLGVVEHPEDTSKKRRFVRERGILGSIGGYQKPGTFVQDCRESKQGRMRGIVLSEKYHMQLETMEKMVDVDPNVRGDCERHYKSALAAQSKQLRQFNPKELFLTLFKFPQTAYYIRFMHFGINELKLQKCGNNGVKILAFVSKKSTFGVAHNIERNHEKMIHIQIHRRKRSDNHPELFKIENESFPGWIENDSIFHVYVKSVHAVANILLQRMFKAFPQLFNGFELGIDTSSYVGSHLVNSAELKEYLYRINRMDVKQNLTEQCWEKIFGMCRTVVFLHFRSETDVKELYKVMRVWDQMKRAEPLTVTLEVPIDGRSTFIFQSEEYSS